MINQKRSLNIILAVVAIIIIIIVGIVGAAKYLLLVKKPMPVVVTPTPIATPTVTPSLILDMTTDWKTYKNEKYHFEIKYPQKGWKECSFTGDKLFLLVQKGQKCYLTFRNEPIDTFSDSIIISSESDIYSKYNNHETLKDAFEKIPNGGVTSITMFSVMGRNEVDNVKESMVGQNKSLIVQILHESYGIISTERYIFYNQNLFNISSVNSPIAVPNTNNKIYDASVINKEIEQIISTFKFIN